MVGADDRAGVGSGNEAGEKRALEHQIGGVVVEQDARGDAGRQRDRQPEREGEPIGPVAPLENQDVAEAAVARQHGGQGRHDGQLAHQRGKQELFCGQESRVRHEIGCDRRTGRTCRTCKSTASGDGRPADRAIGRRNSG